MGCWHREEGAALAYLLCFLRHYHAKHGAAPTHAELGVDVLEVVLHGSLANTEVCGNLTVGQSLAKCAYYVVFSRG